MKILLKYFIWLLSFFSLVFYYFLGTSLGHLSMGSLTEKYVSQKLGNKLEILSLNLENYPVILAKVKINDGALLFLNGNAQRDNILMDYHLQGNGFRWNNYNITEPVNLKGKMNGTVSQLYITGEGNAFYGNTKYSFLKKSNRFESLHVNLKEVSAEHLLKFLKYDVNIKGKIDANMEFEYFSPFRKKGSAHINMNKILISKLSDTLPFDIDVEVVYKDLLRNFFLNVTSTEGELHISEGYYNKSASILKANYILKIKELSYFSKLLKHKYNGAFNTMGTMKQELGKLSLKGTTKSYEGMIKYVYQNEELRAELKAVSLEKVLRQLSFPPLLSAKIHGVASYDLKDEIVLLNTKLKETRFRRTNITNVLQNLTGIDVLKDVYDDSVFTAGYQDSILTSMLRIDNGINHLYLNKTSMNSKTNAVTGEFDLFINEQELLGEIYGTLDDPKVNLDMSQLIRYQVNKKINNFFGTNKPLNKKNTKSKLKNIKKKTGEFLENIF